MITFRPCYTLSASMAPTTPNGTSKNKQSRTSLPVWGGSSSTLHLQRGASVVRADAGKSKLSNSPAAPPPPQFPTYGLHRTHSSICQLICSSTTACRGNLRPTQFINKNSLWRAGRSMHPLHRTASWTRRSQSAQHRSSSPPTRRHQASQQKRQHCFRLLQRTLSSLHREHHLTAVRCPLYSTATSAMRYA